MPATTYVQLVNDIIEECIHDEEGGWQLTNNPDDAGKWTYGGMTWGTFDNYDNRMMNNLYSLEQFIRLARANDMSLREDVRAAYYEGFWKPFIFSNWSTILLKNDPARNIAKMLYSTAVNAGFERAVLLLQATHNTIFEPEDKLIYDGKYGLKTQSALNLMMVTCPIAFTKEYMRRWLQFYADIVKRNSNQLKNGQTRLNQANNLGGWINRVWRFFP